MANPDGSVSSTINDVKKRQSTTFIALDSQLRSQIRTIISANEKLAAYAKAWQATKSIIETLVSNVAETDAQYAAEGLKSDLPAKKAIVNSLMSTWDGVATPAARGKNADIDDAIVKMKNRLVEFDEAIAGAGDAPVRPDT